MKNQSASTARLIQFKRHEPMPVVTRLAILSNPLSKRRASGVLILTSSLELPQQKNDYNDQQDQPD
jgi:hypothetical protein